MSKYFKETKENLKKYYTSGEFSIAAEMLGSEGFMANIYTPERAFYIVTRIMEDAEIVIMEIAPEIHCTSEETINMTAEYANMVNGIHVTGNVKISENGRLYIQVERKFDNVPITCDMLKDMERSALAIATVYAKPLQKLANAKILTATESDPQKLAENHITKMAEEFSFVEKLKSKRRKTMESNHSKGTSGGLLSLLEEVDDDLMEENVEPSFGDIFKMFGKSADEGEDDVKGTNDELPEGGNLLSMLRKAKSSLSEKPENCEDNETDLTDENEEDE